jgi:hypothetical protein
MTLEYTPELSDHFSKEETTSEPVRRIADTTMLVTQLAGATRGRAMNSCQVANAGT